MTSTIQHIHLTGICGTAMGALALMLKERGYRVTGSDAQAYPPMSTVLAENGISVIEGFCAENLQPRPDLVVIGNAMSRGNEEVEAILEQKIRYTSLAEALKEHFIRGRTSLVVTGTHGKTTTASLLAWMLEHAGREPGFMIGGVPRNFSSGARIGAGEFFVTEGDEYDTAFFDKRSKFVHYLPDCVIVNNIEFDHADIFANVEEIELSFRRMLNLVPRNGLVVANARDNRVMSVTEKTWAPRVTFAVETTGSVPADWIARDLRETEAGTTFTLVGPPGEIGCQLALFGAHNVSNAVAVAAIASHVGLTLEEIANGFASFLGVQRRLQRLDSPGTVVLYDDFAHHPTAIKETLTAVRKAHPASRVWALFEPRSNTTVQNIFQHELASALRVADCVVIGEIHRLNRVAPELRLDISRLLNDLRSAGADAQHIPEPDAIIAHVVDSARPDDVIVIMSNGAFGGLAKRLPDALHNASKLRGL